MWMKRKVLKIINILISVDRNFRSKYYKIKHARRFFKRFKTVDFRSWDMVDTLFVLNFEIFCEFYENRNLSEADWDSSQD